MKVRYWTLLVVAVTMMAGPAWGQCVTVCETGDDEVTVRIYDDEGEPFTLARVLENEYENIFFVFDDGAGNVCVVDTWAEELEPADVIDEDGYMVVDLTDEANWYGEYPGWEAFLEAAEFWGAGVEGGSGSPDAEWYNVLSYRLDGGPTFGDWLDAGSASNEGFGCIENPCEPPAPAGPTGTISGNTHRPLVDDDVTLTLSLSNMVDEAPTYQWSKDGGELGGETGDELFLPAVQLDDTGDYSVVVTYVEEGGDAAYAEIEASTYIWVTEAGLPLAGGLGLGLIAGACALAGVVSIRRKK